MKWLPRLQVIFLALLVPIPAGGAAETNFSQHPGFARYFADNPPATTTPNLDLSFSLSTRCSGIRGCPAG